MEFVAPVAAGEGNVLVVACERRVASLGNIDGVQVVQLRCTGQIDAGMLIELTGRAYSRIAVVACPPGECRFGDGNGRARAQLDRAQRMIHALGIDGVHLSGEGH
jgi:coenzyme F420-reducing hydrogenase delta subunit